MQSSRAEKMSHFYTCQGPLESALRIPTVVLSYLKNTAEDSCSHLFLLGKLILKMHTLKNETEKKRGKKNPAQSLPHQVSHGVDVCNPNLCISTCFKIRGWVLVVLDVD